MTSVKNFPLTKEKNMTNNAPKPSSRNNHYVSRLTAFKKRFQGRPEYGEILEVEKALRFNQDGLNLILETWNNQKAPSYIKYTCYLLLSEEIEKLTSILTKYKYLFFQPTLTLDEHLDTVISLALSKDGKILVSGSSDHTIKVWDLSTGKVLKTLIGHLDSVNCVALTDTINKPYIVSGSADKTVKIWSLHSGKVLENLEGHLDIVNCIAISDNGRIVSGSADNNMITWDLQTGKLLTVIEGHANAVNSLIVKGDYIISGSSDNTIKLWSLYWGKLQKIIINNEHPINVIAMTPDQKNIISGGWDNMIKIWSLEEGTLIRAIKTDQLWIFNLQISGDGKTILSASLGDKTVKIWSLSSGELINTITIDSLAVCSLILSADSNTLITGNGDHTITVWSLKLPQLEDFEKQAEFDQNRTQKLTAIHKAITYGQQRLNIVIQGLKNNNQEIQRTAYVILQERKKMIANLLPPDKKTVLVIDDSMSVRELLYLTFMNAGYEVKRASNGQEAWAELQFSWQIDIVFCAIDIPKINGVQLLKKIKHDSYWHNLPVVMLFNSGDLKYRDKITEMGASAYFVKPYLEDQLLETTEKLLTMDNG